MISSSLGDVFVDVVSDAVIITFPNLNNVILYPQA